MDFIGGSRTWTGERTDDGQDHRPKLGETTYDISPYRFEIQRRHVFAMELAEPTPERWSSQELHDGEHEPTNLECFWIPLKAAHVLQSGQGALIGALYD